MPSQTILIIDQEEAIRDSLQFLLADEGYQCFTSRNRDDGLQLLSHQNISIVILDSELAVKTDLLKVISMNYPQTKSIVISSYACLETIRLAVLKEVDEFILKPLNFDELLSLIKKLVSSPKSY